jgi:hypothetical protein
LGIARVGEALGESLEDLGASFDHGQQQGPAIGGDGSSIEACDDRAVGEGFKREVSVGTVCVQRAVFSTRRKGLSPIPLCQGRQPCAIPPVRNMG